MIPLGFFGVLSSAAVPAMELISTTILGTATASVTFSSIPATYKHLEIRCVAKTTNAVPHADLTLNGSSATYSYHRLYGNSSGVFATSTPSASMIRLEDAVSGTTTASAFSAIVVSLPDYRDDANKTVRALSGKSDSDNRINMTSGNWRDATAVSSLTLTAPSSTFAIGSRFSLYGIAG